MVSTRSQRNGLFESFSEWISIRNWLLSKLIFRLPAVDKFTTGKQHTSPNEFEWLVSNLCVRIYNYLELTFFFSIFRLSGINEFTANEQSRNEFEWFVFIIFGLITNWIKIDVCLFFNLQSLFKVRARHRMIFQEYLVIKLIPRILHPLHPEDQMNQDATFRKKA